MKYATANTLKSKVWKNGEISLDELEARLSQTIRTNETIQEYQKMGKAEQSAIKDKGCFVGGHLAGGSRHRETVLCRSMLCLDMDEGVPGVIGDIIEKLPFLCLWHTTHRHTPEAPRYRLVIPLAREVSRDEYPAIGHMVAGDIGIDMFDDTTYEAHRLMHWPTTSKNGEFLFGRVEGPLLNPDSYLARYHDWHDASTWPVSSRRSVAERHAGGKVEDPLSKRGIIGAFCRTYTIQDAIREFIPDVYAPTESKDRWTYAKGEGTAGLVIYEDKFAYSHHGTDPCCGMLLNAFDLIRIHKFRSLDEAQHDDTSVSKLPSYEEMRIFASRDERVHLLIAEERRTGLKEDFGDDWRKKLTYCEGTTEVESTVQNLELILDNDPDFQSFAFNELAGRVQVTGPVPWKRPMGNTFWRDADAFQLMAILDMRYGVFSRRNFDICFSNAVENRSFHPIRDYLDSLPEWDGVKRVEDLFITYLGADDSDYVRQVTRKAFAAAVKRIYEPGCKFDSMVVLDGAQGIGKSTIVRDLVTPDYYSECLSLTDMEDKSGAEKLQGFWVVEIGELAGMKKADIERVKAFVSTQDDKYRPSYGRVVESHPRSCIIIATVNGERGYLRDITGNRRFWVLKLRKTERVKNWEFDVAYRAQFWAEAKNIYLSGENLFLEGDAAAAAEAAQSEAMEQDERVGMVEAFLEIPLPEDWENMDLHARRSFLDDTDSLMHPKGTMQRIIVCNPEIWCECFGRNLSDLKSSDSHALGIIMAQIEGWEKTGTSHRFLAYGKQRIYNRKLRNNPEEDGNKPVDDYPF